MTYIKICGITNLEDALAAAELGVDVLGFNFYKPSPRYIAPESAREIIKQLPRAVLAVGVFVNEESPESVLAIAKEAGVSGLQLHGDESPEFCKELSATSYYVIKALAAGAGFDMQQAEAYDLEVDAILLDTKDNDLRGGTGRVFDWSIARQVKQLLPKLYLAGGLSPENIAEAIERVSPYAVDACSSLEDAPGKKNHARMRAFVERARSG
jgi:phosphoribosylanthranilate isomerase